jgi:hypothetical protein
MIDDIVARLRGYCDGNNDLMDAAADRIEALEKELLEKELLEKAWRIKDDIAYVLDGHGITHNTFTIIYREKKDG